MCRRTLEVKQHLDYVTVDVSEMIPENNLGLLMCMNLDLIHAHAGKYIHLLECTICQVKVKWICMFVYSISLYLYCSQSYVHAQFTINAGLRANQKCFIFFHNLFIIHSSCFQVKLLLYCTFKFNYFNSISVCVYMLDENLLFKPHHV